MVGSGSTTVWLVGSPLEVTEARGPADFQDRQRSLAADGQDL